MIKKDKQYFAFGQSIDVFRILEGKANIYWKTVGNIYLGCGDRLAFLYGFNSGSDLINKPDLDVAEKENALSYIKNDRKVFSANKTHCFFEEMRPLNKNVISGYRGLSIKTPLAASSGALVGVFGLSFVIEGYGEKADELFSGKIEPDVVSSFMLSKKTLIESLKSSSEKEAIKSLLPTPTINKDNINENHSNLLTPREIECLYWFAQGKSCEETAIILGIKKRTVDTHLENMKEKLNCTKQTSLIYKAMKLGVLW